MRASSAAPRAERSAISKRRGERLHAALALREIAQGERDLLRAFDRLRRASYPWLLESSRVDGGLGRFSFAGADPWAVLRARGRVLSLEVRRAVRPDLLPGRHESEGDPLDALRALLCPQPIVPSQVATRGDLPPFLSGAVGWLGHELGAVLERVACSPASDDDLPDVAMLLVDRVLALDHASGSLFAAGTGFGATPDAARARAESACGAIASDVADASRGARAGDAGSAPCGAREMLDEASPDALPPGIHAAFDASSYGKLVERVKQRIAAGDLYQACLTHRLDAPPADPWALYTALRRESPAPFAAFLTLPEATLAGGSPERFLRVTHEGVVESRPIKGTRPRGATAADDARLHAELSASAKDRAENVMIVDLVRNDLGRVCEVGSVSVPVLCEIEAHPTLFQLVSTVTGRLAAGRDGLDAVRAAFPPGSMTGAPKLAAIDLLARLEPVRRGPYGGALGWIDARGGLDLSVVIRSAIVRGDCVHYHTGGGIVADSEAPAEWRESLDKARAFFRAQRAI